MSDRPDETPGDSGRDVGIALSGGGHRATVFGLGALLAVVDAGLHRRTLSISSVSGGSIANGAVMVGPDFGTAEPGELEQHFATVVQAIAERGVLQGGAPATSWYLRQLIASAVVTAIGVVAALVFAVIGEPLLFAIAALVTLVAAGLAWWLFGRRSEMTERAIDAELLGGRRTTLADQAARQLSVNHVLCTTELQSGVTFYFGNRLSYGWQFGGTTTAADIPLAVPVQASACVPGAFRARVVPLASLGLPSAAVQGSSAGRPGAIDDLVLEDGGVYDNMADGWEYGFSRRLRSWPALAAAQPTAARRVMIVNASKGWDELMPAPTSGIRLEIAGLLRSQGVQYDVSTAHRRQALMAGFIAASRTAEEDDTEGVFVQIRDSPYRLLSLFEPAAGRTPDAASRRALEARAFLDAHGTSEAAWAERAAQSAAVATTLKPLGATVCADLLEHGYFLAAANLHVVFGNGATHTPPPRAHFERIAGVR